MHALVGSSYLDDCPKLYAHDYNEGTEGQRTSNLFVKHGVQDLIALSFLYLAVVGSSRMNFAHSLGFDSAGWTCDDVSRSKGKLLLGISTLVEGNSVVEQDLAVPCDGSLALSSCSIYGATDSYR